MMSVVCTDMEDHAGAHTCIHGVECNRLRSVACVITEGHVDVAVCAAPEAMLLSVGLTDPSGLCCPLRPCGYP